MHFKEKVVLLTLLYQFPKPNSICFTLFFIRLISRSSRSDVFCDNFAKFAEKNLSRRLFLIKLQAVIKRVIDYMSISCMFNLVHETFWTYIVFNLITAVFLFYFFLVNLYKLISNMLYFINYLSANSTSPQPTNCLSVFDHFVGFALKGLKTKLPLYRNQRSSGHMNQKFNQKLCTRSIQIIPFFKTGYNFFSIFLETAF